jgi:hypothetical protein
MPTASLSAASLIAQTQQSNAAAQKQLNQTTASAVEEWQASLTPKERQLHELAAVKLKKVLVPSDMPAGQDADNGSYYPEKCHAFKAWKKANDK